MEQKTFFSKKSVMEVSKGQAVKDGWATGCIFMKAFPLEKGGREKQIALKIIPEEAWSIARIIKLMLAGKVDKQEVAYHAHPEGKTATSLSLSTKEYEGKKFRVLYFARKKKDSKNDKGETVSFPMKDDDFSFLAALLEKFALESCYNKRVEDKDSGDDLSGNGGDFGESTDTGETDDGAFDDIPF
jgi:hypothetical protein